MPNNFWKTSVFIGLISIAPLMAHAAPVAKTQAPEKSAPSQNDFPDIPRNHWAYVAMGQLERARLIPSPAIPALHGDRRSGPLVLTRYEVAVATARAMDALSQVPRMETLHLRGMSWTQIEREFFARWWLSQFDDPIAALQAEFAPELERLGARGSHLENRLPLRSNGPGPPRSTINPSRPGAIELGDK